MFVNKTEHELLALSWHAEKAFRGLFRFMAAYSLAMGRVDFLFSAEALALVLGEEACLGFTIAKADFRATGFVCRCSFLFLLFTTARGGGFAL